MTGTRRNCKHAACAIVCFFISLSLTAQDTLRLTRQESEAIFLRENLMLIAEKMNISQAEAMVSQVKLWPNPEFEIDQANLSSRQPNEFTMSVEQIIQTAGKRRKLISLELVSVEKSKEQFEDVLRNLKSELRSQLTNLQYLQLSIAVCQRQLQSVTQLTVAYENQVKQGNIAKNEYIRLKALELEILKSVSNMEQELDKSRKELRLLMHLPHSTYIVVSADDYIADRTRYAQATLSELIEQARANRPDIKIARLDQTYYEKLHDYERARRTPDVKLRAGYDKAGGVYKNFFGLGASIGLPLFNRNQGNIRYADIAREQSEILYRQKELNVEGEVAEAFQHLTRTLDFLKNVEPEYEMTLDEMLAAYTKNFKSRHIGMLEYLDFMDTYGYNKKIILDSIKDILMKADDINFLVGKDIFP